MRSSCSRMLIICCAVIAILGPTTSSSQVNDTQKYIVTIDDNNTFIYNDRGICIISGRMSQDHLYEIKITYENSTIVADVAPSQYQMNIYIYGYRHDTGNAMIFTNNDKYVIKNMLSSIAKKQFGSKPIEKLVVRTLNLIYSWPIDTEVFMSMDKSSVVTMMGEHPGAVRLWSEIMPQSQELHSATSDKVIISLCGEINEIESALYLTGLGCLDVVSKPYQVGPYPFNSGGCFGRCGRDCIGDGPPDNGLNIFTQDCFNHDACVQEQGPFDPCCDEMFALAAYDFLYGRSCTPVLKVTLEPNEARGSGTWQIKDDPFDIDSGWHASGSSIDWLPSGVYVLNFSNIDGWQTPSPKEITIIQEYTASAVGTYLKSLPPGPATTEQLQVFVRGGDNAPYQMLWDGSNWHGWIPFSGLTTNEAPAVASHNGQLQLFVRGIDYALYQLTWDGSNWHGWYGLGGYLASAPAVVSHNGQLHVFVVGVDHALWWMYWDGSNWHGWYPLGGYILGTPAAASYNGQLQVFVTGEDHALWQLTWDGSKWNGWYGLGGYLAYGPGATSWNGQLHVFVTGADYGLWQMYSDGSQWHGWFPFGGYIIGSPGAVSYNGQLDVCVTGGDHAIWWEAFDGTKWSGWYSLGGYTPSAPAVASYQPPG